MTCRNPDNVSEGRYSLFDMEKLGDFREVHERTDQELVSMLAHLYRAENSLAATRYATLAEIDRRGLASKLGHSSLSRWFARSTHITDGAATHQITLAHWLTEHPRVLTALCDSMIHAAQARAIADGLATVVIADATIDREHRAAVVADLLGTAVAGSTANQVSSRAQVLAHAAAEDARARYAAARSEQQAREKSATADRGAAGDNEDADSNAGNSDDADDDSPQAKDARTDDDSATEPSGPPPVPVSENTDLNKFDIFNLPSGRSRFTGDVDRLLAEKLMTTLDLHSAPRPGPDGERDPRSASKRRADALDNILDRHLQGSRQSGRSRPSVHLTVPLRELLTQPRRDGSTPQHRRRDSTSRISSNNSTPSGRPSESAAVGDPERPIEASRTREGNRSHHSIHADPGSTIGPDDPDWPFQLDWTGPISRELAELIACDADLTPVIVDHNGVPLAMGRTIRLATSAQRTAVMLRDRCCIKCGRPAQWCEFHHVTYWSDSGRTDVNNLALICSQCHRFIHNSEWELVMGDDGLPYLVPPESIDPDRKRIPSFYRRQLASARAHRQSSAVPA